MPCPCLQTARLACADAERFGKRKAATHTTPFQRLQVAANRVGACRCHVGVAVADSVAVAVAVVVAVSVAAAVDDAGCGMMLDAG